MRIILFPIIVLLFIAKDNLNAQRTELDTLDRYIPSMMEHFQTPGLAIAIVKDSRVLYSKGFGTRIIEKDAAVDSNTLFAIGSISKSFTSLALAMLVDEGKIDWDDKVKDYVPYFELYNPYVTNSFTIRDLLTHRSGLNWVSGGTLWYHSDFNREEIIRRLKYLEPVSEFRTEPAYQNTMYIVASKVVEAVIDGSWDDFVRNRIFEPLRMTSTVISQAERKLSKNISQPHIKNENFEIIAIEQEKLDNMAPAGAIYSNANDMAHYIMFLLNDGVYNGDTLISKNVFNEIFTPQIHFPLFDRPINNEFTSYGLGWWITPKNDNMIIQHSGGIDGMTANLMMEKNNQFGVIVLSNSSFGRIRFALTFDIIGAFLNDQDFLTASMHFKEEYLGSDSILLAERKKLYESRKENTHTSLPLKEYAGNYEDEMYGEINIRLENQSLKISFCHTPLFNGTLSHWHYDTFKIDWIDPRVPDGFLTFEFNSKGKVIGFNLDQPNLLDVDFTELEIHKKDIAIDKMQ